MNQEETIEALARLAAEHVAPESLTGAAAAGDLTSVRAFLDAGADIEEKSVGFSSPLQAAVNSGCVEVVDWLLSHGAQVEKKPDALHSPLASAATWGYQDLFRRLAAMVRDASGERAALVTLASYGLLDELRLLLEKGAMPDARYAIAAAAKNGHYDIVKHLVDAGVAWKEFTALRIPEGARDAGFKDLFHYLTDQPYDESSARASGHLARDKKLANLAAQMKSIQDKRRVPDPARRLELINKVNEAVSRGVLGKLIDKPLIPAGNFGMVPPLLVALLVGDLSLAQALLAAGAKPAPKLKGGMQANHMARGPQRPALLALLESTASAPKKTT